MSDIIELLKANEEEMEGVLEEARERARTIKAETAKAVDDLREGALKDRAAEAETIKARESKRVGLETEKIEEEGKLASKKVAKKAEARKEEAVTLVYNRITGKE